MSSGVTFTEETIEHEVDGRKFKTILLIGSQDAVDLYDEVTTISQSMEYSFDLDQSMYPELRESIRKQIADSIFWQARERRLMLV